MNIRVSHKVHGFCQMWLKFTAKRRFVVKCLALPQYRWMNSFCCMTFQCLDYAIVHCVPLPVVGGRDESFSLRSGFTEYTLGKHGWDAVSGPFQLWSKSWRWDRQPRPQNSSPFFGPRGQDLCPMDMLIPSYSQHHALTSFRSLSKVYLIRSNFPDFLDKKSTLEALPSPQLFPLP